MNKHLKKVEVEDVGYSRMKRYNMKQRIEEMKDPQDAERRKKAWLEINEGNPYALYTLPMMCNVSTEYLEKQAWEKS